MVDDARAGAEEPAFEIEPSELDELTHREMLGLYADAESNVRFAKGLQWKTMGGTIAIFTLLVTAVHTIEDPGLLSRVGMILSVAVSGGAIYALTIYQAWQKTERNKINTILPHLSTLARQVHGVRSRSEANVYRYILLSFMVILIVMANYVTYLMLQPYFVAK